MESTPVQPHPVRRCAFAAAALLVVAAVASAQQLLKAAWAKGATVQIGQNFTTIGLTYQYRWF
jgi:hypothetical protein